MTKPIISVVMPTWNRAHYLNDAVASILNQGIYQKKKEIADWKPFTDFEIIIVDDGSTDGTDQLGDYLAQSDPRIHYFKRPHQGIAKTRNFGIQQAQGTYIAVHDSDDWMAKDRLYWTVKTLEKGDCDVVYGAYHVTNEFGQFDNDSIIVPPKEVTKAVILANNPAIPHPTLAAKRNCFLDHPYRAELRSNDDLWLLADWFLAGYRFKYIDRSLIAYRYHAGSVGLTDQQFIAANMKQFRDWFTNA